MIEGYYFVVLFVIIKVFDHNTLFTFKAFQIAFSAYI